MPAEAPLDGLDAYEQQLASITGNSYDAHAKYVTSNLNLWPRPLVIVMGNEAYDSLTKEQQSVLRDAAEAAIPKALEASRAEDEEAVGHALQTRHELRHRVGERPCRVSNRPRDACTHN